jgi:hypothetical protein
MKISFKAAGETKWWDNSSASQLHVPLLLSVTFEMGWIKLNHMKLPIFDHF